MLQTQWLRDASKLRSGVRAGANASAGTRQRLTAVRREQLQLSKIQFAMLQQKLANHEVGYKFSFLQFTTYLQGLSHTAGGPGEGDDDAGLKRARKKFLDPATAPRFWVRYDSRAMAL